MKTIFKNSQFFYAITSQRIILELTSLTYAFFNTEITCVALHLMCVASVPDRVTLTVPEYLVLDEAKA